MNSIVARDGPPTTSAGQRPAAREHRWAPRLLGVAIAGSVALSASADDLDVYRASLEAQKRPNVLFVLDYSGSMGRGVPGTGATRIETLKNAVRAVVSNNQDRVNFGIGSIYKSEVSGVRLPAVPMRDEARTLDASIPQGVTNRDVLFGHLDRLPARGGTATVNALAEASAYFRGSRIGRGRIANPDRWNRASSRYEGGDFRSALPVSHGGGRDPRYDSPVESCQANAVILVSDGQPTVRLDDGRLRDAVGAPTRSCRDLSGPIFSRTGRQAEAGNCGPEIADRLATPGSIPGHPDSVINTYTIGFGIDGAGARYLEEVARAGDGSALVATDEDSLTEALEALLLRIGGGNQSFSGPSVDVDRTSFSHGQRAYYNLFEPSLSNAWQGNLKGYFLSPDGLRSLDGTAATETTDDGIAVFSDDAHSFWSADADGNDVLVGGATEQLAAGAGTAEAMRIRADARTLYTYLGNRATGTPISLAGSRAHALSTANPGLAARGLGLPGNAAARNALIERLRAAPMGDPLHSQAVGLDYPGRKLVFTMTNQGLLHAFDATRPTGDAVTGSTDTGGGEELWAFMPKRLLANLPALAAETRGGEHVYGLDGGITRWHDDDDGDGTVDPGERALLVFGMRRGGSSYYALDVSDPSSPRLVWEIDPSVPGFERLGESWSRPALVSAASSSAPGGEERFLVLGGGYDAAALDDRDAPTASRGNAVYVVDADGDAVWSVDGDDVATMRYAIPSDPTLIDSDADGRADRLYVGDLGGQMWRIDFDDMRNAADYRVTRLADLAGGSHQPFFYPPSVAYHRTGNTDFLSVSIGSGNRPDPMRPDSDNAFYMLRDTDVARGAPASTFTTIRAAQLYDASDDRLGATGAATVDREREKLADARGWRIDLRPGEKSLSAAVSFEGRLLATTFEPSETIAPGACAPVPTGRFYQMDILTGRPVSLASDAPSDPDARHSRLNTGGIPSTPLSVFPKGADQVSVVVDRQIVSRFAQDLSRVFWHAR